MPPSGFSFFDPFNEKYVTLRSAALPVQIEGDAIAGKSSVASSSPNQASDAETTGIQTGGYPLSDQQLAGNRGIVRPDLHAAEFLVRADRSTRRAVGICVVGLRN